MVFERQDMVWQGMGAKMSAVYFEVLGHMLCHLAQYVM